MPLFVPLQPIFLRPTLRKDIYEIRRRGAWLLIIAAAAVVALFMWFSDSLVTDLSEQERQRMELWADATRRLASDTRNGEGADVDFMLSVIEANRTIPVLLTDDRGEILLHRNFTLPQQPDSADPTYISPQNLSFLQSRLETLRKSGNVIDIEIDPENGQHLYYEDSTLLRQLSLYPYIQTLVMLAFVATVYFAVTSTKKAEQNKVWVGLSKETAHQLGTPISSLMAWTQMLASGGTDPSVIEEMDKDIDRLAAIAARFSKVGSRPALEPDNPDTIVEKSVSYMRGRISRSVSLISLTGCGDVRCNLCAPLLEWVMENLIKNSVDAMDGTGAITVTSGVDKDSATVAIEVADTGKGLPKKLFKSIFRPGFTTKKRGWGLGLAMARRIVEEYHHGKIFVKSSEPGTGTIIRIELPVTGSLPSFNQ